MTPPSRHKIKNSSPGDLRSSTLPLGPRGFPKLFNLYGWAVKKHSVSLKFKSRGWARTRDLTNGELHLYLTKIRLERWLYPCDVQMYIRLGFWVTCSDGSEERRRQVFFTKVWPKYSLRLIIPKIKWLARDTPLLKVLCTSVHYFVSNLV